FHSSRDRQLVLARPNRVGRVHHGAHAGAADLVKGDAGNRVGDSRTERRLAGGSLADSGLEDVAHDDLLHLVRFDSRFFQGATDGGGAQGRGGERRKLSKKRTDGRPLRGENHYLFHGRPILSLGVVARVSGPGSREWDSGKDGLLSFRAALGPGFRREENRPR